MKRIQAYIILFAVAAVAVISCRKREGSSKAALFTAMDAGATGLDFANRLTPDSSLNMFKYMYFYNGAGVGAADFNNDGLTDLFFAGNQAPNRLYLNKGGLQFTDVTGAAGIVNDGGWSTGVSVVDINHDGLMDIYVCRVGRFERLQHRNQLLVCTGIDASGIPRYENQAAAYGLGFQGFSTQAAFLDYDLDGDLDMYLLNHSLRYNSTFQPRSSFFNTYDYVSGDRFYRNDGVPVTLPSGERKGGFTDITQTCGINSSVIGYGLGIAVSDINLDGWPDLYIGNDFQENDYLYINQKNGTFKDVLTEQIMHTSQFSMGVDVADINNDALPEIVSMDMLPSDPYILKRSLGEDEYETFNYKLSYGYHYQYARNCLQLNQGNGHFTEAGLYAGIYATDWSWAALWMDFDNDGLKDLFVSNGIPKRLNDIDYVNFVSNTGMQEKIRSNSVGAKEMNLVNNFPQIKLPNRFFRNKGDVRFEDLSGRVAGNPDTYSNGAVYADFDNDGDLDIVVNNIDEPATLYRNNASGDTAAASVTLRLKGSPQNPGATGARVFVFANGGVRAYEHNPYRGFQGSMQTPIIIGLKQARIDSALLVWPGNTYERLRLRAADSVINAEWKPGLPVFDFSVLTNRRSFAGRPAAEVTAATGLLYRHEENVFNEFNREQLIPRMTSAEGPALAVGDLNGDGLEDVFTGSSKWKQSALFLQQPNGKFVRSVQPAFVNDSTYEDVDACFTDVNNDGYTDLVVASGGNEFYGHDQHTQPRVYMNDGRGRLTRLPGAFEQVWLTASCVEPYDFNGDGFTDLFVGGRAVPFEYGQIPQSFLLQNDGSGRFKDVTAQYSKELMYAGLIKHAVWADMDGDKDKDLVLAPEWGPVTIYANEGRRFAKKEIPGCKGWWNCVLPFDADGDGDMDILAGNLGLNSRLTATEQEPVRMYYEDFDGNAKKEQALCYYLNGRELPFANKAELEKQMPVLKKKYLYAGDFAKAGINDLFGRGKLKSALLHEAGCFASSLFINDGKGNFTVTALPWQAQLSPVMCLALADVNNDGKPDVLAGQNFYESNIQMGRYDGGYGLVLINRGGGRFEAENLNGLVVKGQVRQIQPLRLAGNRTAYIMARNNDSLVVAGFR